MIKTFLRTCYHPKGKDPRAGPKQSASEPHQRLLPRTAKGNAAYVARTVTSQSRVHARRQVEPIMKERMLKKLMHHKTWRQARVCSVRLGATLLQKTQMQSKASQSQQIRGTISKNHRLPQGDARTVGYLGTTSVRVQHTKGPRSHQKRSDARHASYGATIAPPAEATQPTSASMHLRSKQRIQNSPTDDQPRQHLIRGVSLVRYNASSVLSFLV